MEFDESAYRLFRGNLYRFAYRHLRDPMASEDVVQDSFLKLAQYQSESVTNISALLHRIASNQIIDLIRKRKRRVEDTLPDRLDLPTNEPSQEKQLFDKQKINIVLHILDQMPPLRREVFMMRRLHGMSAKEVAKTLAITPAAVDTHVARALMTLHKELNDGVNSDAARTETVSAE